MKKKVMAVAVAIVAACLLWYGSTKGWWAFDDGAVVPAVVQPQDTQPQVVKRIPVRYIDVNSYEGLIKALMKAVDGNWIRMHGSFNMAHGISIPANVTVEFIPPEPVIVKAHKVYKSPSFPCKHGVNCGLIIKRDGTLATLTEKERAEVF